MKKYQQVIAIILALMLVVPVSAATVEDVAPCASTYLQDYDASISVVSSSQFRVRFEAYGYEKLSKIGASSITIYRSTDGVNWSDWQTVSGKSGMTASNSRSHSSYIDFDGDGTIYYMAKVTIIATKGSVTETRTVTTGSIKM